MISGKHLLMAMVSLACAGCAIVTLAQDAGANARFAAGYSKVTTVHSIDVPAGQLSPQIDELTSKANAGDARAAALLSTALGGCLQFKRLPNQTNWMSRCAGVTDEQLSQVGHWLDVAAQGGDPDAQYAYSAGGFDVVVGAQNAQRNPAAFTTYKAKAKNYLLALAQRCNYDAIATIASNGADDGLIFGDDPVTAYKFARVQALLESPSAQSQSQSAMTIAKLQRRLDAAGTAALSGTEATAFADHYCR